MGQNGLIVAVSTHVAKLHVSPHAVPILPLKLTHDLLSLVWGGGGGGFSGPSAFPRIKCSCCLLKNYFVIVHVLPSPLASRRVLVAVVVIPVVFVCCVWLFGGLVCLSIWLLCFFDCQSVCLFVRPSVRLFVCCSVAIHS